MPNPLEVSLYLRHLRERWKTVAAVAAVAGAVALLVSLALPNKYDATVTLLIQPGASDPRYPPPLNQVYLEYLRSYEYVVQGDELLARVLKEFQLGGEPYGYTVDSFRRRVLDVRLFKNSKLLAVRVRFGDPQKAHQIALFLAREAMKASEALKDADTDRSVRQIGRDLEQARTRLAQAESEVEAFRRQAREDELFRTIQVEMESKSEYQRQLGSLRVRVPELEARVAALRGQLKETPDKLEMEQQVRGLLDEAVADLEGARAKHKAVERALADLAAPLARHQAELLHIQTREQEVQRNYQAARDAFTMLSGRANEARMSAASRSEQLQIADPGIVPERPATPHILFNVLLALSLGALAALAYETWAWNWEQEVFSERAVSPRAGVR